MTGRLKLHTRIIFCSPLRMCLMRKRKVLSDNEWMGWLRWMKSAFEQGTINEIWKTKVEIEKWFDPPFKNSLTRS